MGFLLLWSSVVSLPFVVCPLLAGRHIPRPTATVCFSMVCGWSLVHNLAGVAPYMPEACTFEEGVLTPEESTIAANSKKVCLSSVLAHC